MTRRIGYAPRASSPAIVDRKVFEAAQRILQTRGKTTIAGRPRNLTNDEMLRRLRDVFETRGHLSRAAINANHELPSADAYAQRFGGLKTAFELIGAPHRRKKDYTRRGRPCGLSNDEMLDVLRQLWKEHHYLTGEIIKNSPMAPNLSVYFTRFGSLRRAYQLIGFVPDPERTRPPRVVRGISDDALLDILRDLLRRHGHLSKSIMESDGSGLCHGTLAYRFGGLLNAYRLIGYTSPWQRERNSRPHGLSDEEMLNALRRLWEEQGYLSQRLLRKVTSVPSYHEYCLRFGALSAAYKLIGFKSTAPQDRT